MPDIPIYIHYGADHFVPERFIPVRNGSFMPKPADGTGLWASRVDAAYGWAEWCRENHFHLERLRRSFRFHFAPEGKILALTDPVQLIDLPKTKPWSLKDLSWIYQLAPGQRPTDKQLESFYAPNWCHLDYVKLAKEYDAIELMSHGNFEDELSTWDCDCLLVLKADHMVMEEP